MLLFSWIWFFLHKFFCSLYFSLYVALSFVGIFVHKIAICLWSPNLQMSVTLKFCSMSLDLNDTILSRWISLEKLFGVMSHSEYHTSGTGTGEQISTRHKNLCPTGTTSQNMPTVQPLIHDSVKIFSCMVLPDAAFSNLTWRKATVYTHLLQQKSSFSIAGLHFVVELLVVAVALLSFSMCCVLTLWWRTNQILHRH